MMRRKKSFRTRRQLRLWRSMPVTHKREHMIPIIVFALDALVWFLCFCAESCDRQLFCYQIKSMIRIIPCKLLSDCLMALGSWVYGFMNAAVESYGDYSSFAITCAGICTAVVVLFYSLIDSKSFGIPHRTIVHYFFGSMTIPVVFAFCLVKLPVLKFLGYLNLNVMGSLLATWCIVQQIALIFFTTLSTSYRFCIRVICWEEMWQYRKQRELDEHTLKYFDAWKTPHVSCAMISTDLFRDKCRLLKEILWVPVEYCEKNASDFLNGTAWERECEYMFDYYYGHVYGAMEAVSESGDKENRDKIYTILYEFLVTFYREVSGWNEDFPETDGEYQANLRYSVTSAIMYAILVSEGGERIGACIYILNSIVEDAKQRNRQMVLYFLMLHILWISGEEPKILSQNAEYIEGFDEWNLKTKDKDFYRKLWRMMTRKTTIREKDAEQQFDMAWNTCMYFEHKSAIMEIMIEKREGAA